MSQVKAKVRRAKKHQTNPCQREEHRNLKLYNRQKKLLMIKARLGRKLQILKTIEANIMHNGISCPNKTDKQCKQCPATMSMESHLSDNGRASRECYPINENMIDHTLGKTRKSLNECESAIRINCDHNRNTSNEHLSSCGYNLWQSVCARAETGEQACTVDNCPAMYASTGFGSSSSGYERTDLLVSTAGVKLDTHIETVPVHINQARTISTQAEIIQDCSFKINHTQEDLKNYLQDKPSDCPVYAGASLEDVLDVMSKICQPPNSQLQDQQNDHHSGSTSYPVRDNSPRSEEQHRYENRRGRRITEHQSCIKSRTLPSQAKINAQAEDDVAEKSRAESELKGFDIVNVVTKRVAILKLDDMSK